MVLEVVVLLFVVELLLVDERFEDDSLLRFVQGWLKIVVVLREMLKLMFFAFYDLEDHYFHLFYVSLKVFLH